MTPSARVAAAIEVLQEMKDGLAAEQALTRWARGSRFAGSKDRAAIRDHVFDVLRNRSSAAHYGKANTPRALMIGLLHLQQADLNTLFSGEGYGPTPLSDDEKRFPAPPEDKHAQWSLPDWLIPAFETSLGDEAEVVAIALQDRAPVTLRVNTAKTTLARAQDMLAEVGIATQPNTLTDTALTVTEGARKIRNSPAYQEGLVELQDAASQTVVAALPKGGRVLDYCAGGGGKALALAVDTERAVFAHDIDPRRMHDLPTRAARAGADITALETNDIASAAPFDTVLCDAPCSGSGAWRRSPEGKWTLTAERLGELTKLQDSILDQAADLTHQTGTLAYATCSLLRVENEERIDAFLARHSSWTLVFSRRFSVDAQGDGFFTAHLKRDQ